MMGAALIVVVLTSNLIGVIIGVAMAAVGVYFLIRPPSLDFFVETTEDTLVIKAVATNRIALRDVRSAELWRPEYPALLRGFLNFFSALGNLFGGRNEMIKPDAPPNDVIVRFQKWVWLFFVVPPLWIPRRNWVLMVEDATLLRDDLNKRLGFPAHEAGGLGVDAGTNQKPEDASTAGTAPAEASRVPDEGGRSTRFPESLRTTVRKGRLLDEEERRRLRLELAKLVREGVLNPDRVAEVLEAEGWGADAAFDFAESVVREARTGG